jgi:hypothetical protein
MRKEENKMTNEMWLFLSVVLAVAGIFIFAWIWLKENLPLIAGREDPKLFTTVKKGKIIAIKVAGKITGYYGNLADQGKHVDRETGKVLDGKDDELESSFLWQEFGVIWMGFGGSVYQYPFEKMDMVDGTIQKIKTTASSIFLKNRFIVMVDDAETKEMVAIKLVAQLITETVHAGLSLDYDNWISVVESQVKSACRDFIAAKDGGLREITKEQLEGNGELFKYVKALNGNVGNPGLPEQIGQNIVGFSVMTLEIADEGVKNALQSGEIATEKMKGKVIDAEAEAAVIGKIAAANLEKAKKEAEGIEAIGNARNKILKETTKLVYKKGAERLEETRAMAEAVGKFPGKALSLGAGNIPVILGDSEEKDKKGEKSKK